MAAVAALAVALQQVDDHRQGLRGGRAALQPQPHQIHADQGAPSLGRDDRMQGLIADADAMLIGPHLRPPGPERAAEQAGVGRLGLGDDDVGGRKPRARRMASGRRHLQELGLIALAVAVLGEQQAAAGGGGRQGHEGVAHKIVSAWPT